MSTSRPIVVRAGCTLVIVVLTLSMMPVNTQADIFGEVVKMRRDPFRSGSVEYSGVIHGYESWCYSPDGSSCSGQALWVTAGFITNKGWWNKYSPLKSAYLYVYGRYGHVAWADPSMNPVLAAIRLYHHCPLHGTNDDWNRVGWNDWIDSVFIYGYVKASWDIPKGSKNSVYKGSGGRYLSNYVYVPSSTSLWDAKASWSKVLACNAMKYKSASGWDAEIYVSSTTWNRDWDWGRWWWKDTYRSQSDTFVVDYL